MDRLAQWLVIALASAAVALPAGATARVPAERPGAIAAATCAKETKRLEKFQRGMKAAKRRYFRSHRSTKVRKRFVKAQRRKLARLRRARKRCLAKPAPVPAPQPAPVTGGTGGGTPVPAPAPTPQPGPPARDAIGDVVSDEARFEPDEVSTENGVEYVRTQLELELAPGATKPAMDALLGRLDAQVVSSLKGVGVFTVRIPDPGSLTAARALVAGLAGDPVLAAAEIATVPVTTELPDTITPADAGLLRPQLASRAGAMWNARGALSTGTAPTLVVTDYFGAGAPGPELAAQETASDFATGNPHTHGYTMLGLAVGTFEPGAVANLQADQVTGMWAGPDLPLRVIDLRIAIAASTLEDRILQLVGSLQGDVIVSTSLASGCAPAGCTADQIRTDALQWIQRVRGAGLENRFLHVVAAGNIYPTLPSDTAAALGSNFVAAAKTTFPGVDKLTNTLVVENTTASSPASGPIRPVCLTNTSKRGGDVSAVGNDIKSFGAPGVFRDLPLGGTSSAAPQVAGTAATVWGLAPSFAPADVVSRLRNTARPVVVDSSDARCTTVQPAPALDAYAATLGADRPGSLPARAAVLDADVTGQPAGVTRFDEDDLTAFGDALVAGAGAVDYGRYDLNGDGRTGGTTTDRVDLDPAAGDPQWGLVQRTVAGIPLTYDETALTDREVLCYAAHTALYQGDETVRDALAEEDCLPPMSMQAVHPSTIQAGQTLTLNVRVSRTDRPGGQAGVPIELDVTGGSATPVGGFTDQNGDFTAQTQIASGASELRIVVTAKAAGDRILDQETVTATRAASATVVRTFSRGSATAFAMANGSGQGDPDVSPPGVTSFDGSASMSRSEAGDTASGQGTISFAEGYAGDQLRGVEVEISGSAEAGGQMASGEGGGGYTLNFTVGAGGIAYSVAGSVSANGADPLSCTAARGHSYLFRSTQPSGFVYDTCAPGDPSDIDSSGTLTAGSYEFYVDAIANTGGSGSSSAAADVKLTLGP